MTSKVTHFVSAVHRDQIPQPSDTKTSPNRDLSLQNDVALFPPLIRSKRGSTTCHNFNKSVIQFSIFGEKSRKLCGDGFFGTCTRTSQLYETASASNAATNNCAGRTSQFVGASTVNE